MSRRPEPGDAQWLLDHQGALRKLALALEPHAADDLVQDTWESALRRPPSGEIPADRWLQGVLRNLWRMRRRTDARRYQREGASELHATAIPAPDVALDDHRRLQQLEDRVARLPPPLQAVVRQRYFDGLTAAEIARQTGLPAGTVRRRLKEGLDRLRAEASVPGGSALVLGAFEHAKPSGLAAQVLAMKATTQLAVAAVAVAVLAGGAFTVVGRPQSRTQATAPASTEATRPSRGPNPSLPATAPIPDTKAPDREASKPELTPAQRSARAHRDEVLEGILRTMERHGDWPHYPGPEVEGELAPDYIRDRIQSDLIPAARSCYNQILLRDPDYQGKIVVDFTLVADENLGGVVENVDLVEGTDIDNEQMRECLRDAMYSVVFDPPEDGGSVRVNYAIEFEPD